MNIIRSMAVLAASGALLAGCGKAPEAAPSTSPTTVTIADLVTTTTTSAPTTTTTSCIASLTDTQQALRADQATLDSNLSGRRQIDGTIAQIQLTIDNTARQIDIEQRYVATVQADYNNAVATYGILGTDTAKKKMDDQASRLADAKSVLASWQAIKTKAMGDLSRAKASAADYDKAIVDEREVVAADQHQVAAAQSGSC